MQLLITKPAVSDAQEIITFLNKVGGETDFLTFGLNDFPISIEEEQKIIAECLETEEQLMLIGTVEHTIVSHLFIERTTNPRLAHIGHLGLSVSKAHWGKEIASKMLAQAIDWTKKKSLHKVQLQVRIDNHAAIHLYKKFGFVCEGTITQSLKIQEHCYDELIMGLRLSR